MNVNIEKFEQFVAHGRLVRRDWGNLKTTAFLISSLAESTSIEQCQAAGWPKWLAEIGVWIFDGAADFPAAITDGRAFAAAVKSAADRGFDFDVAYRAVRMGAILPIAMSAIGDGEEVWRIDCRNVVQAAIDCGGGTLTTSQREQAAWAAEAAGAAARTKIIATLITSLEGK
jgi:hypothetical protein